MLPKENHTNDKDLWIFIRDQKLPPPDDCEIFFGGGAIVSPIFFRLNFKNLWKIGFCTITDKFLG